MFGFIHRGLKNTREEYVLHWEHNKSNQNDATCFLTRFFSWFLLWVEYSISSGLGRPYFEHIVDTIVHQDHDGGGARLQG